MVSWILQPFLPAVATIVKYLDSFSFLGTKSYFLEIPHLNDFLLSYSFGLELTLLKVNNTSYIIISCVIIVLLLVFKFST